MYVHIHVTFDRYFHMETRFYTYTIISKYNFNMK